jgi:hypothetical protein
MGRTWKTGGYEFRMYQNDHLPLHVHVFKDKREVARYDLENGRLMAGSDMRHLGRIERALRRLGLIG